MAGFFGLFGNKTKYIDDKNQEDDVQINEKKEPFFLTSDESKTMGNIEFMRSPVGKKKKLTSTESNPISDSQVEAPKPNNGNNGNVSGSSRRGSDPNLDIFRNMAKEIRKG